LGASASPAGGGFQVGAESSSRRGRAGKGRR
jgi:hypothetical protein